MGTQETQAQASTEQAQPESEGLHTAPEESTKSVENARTYARKTVPNDAIPKWVYMDAQAEQAYKAALQYIADSATKEQVDGAIERFTALKAERSLTAVEAESLKNARKTLDEVKASLATDEVRNGCKFAENIAYGNDTDGEWLNYGSRLIDRQWSLDHPCMDTDALRTWLYKWHNGDATTSKMSDGVLKWLKTDTKCLRADGKFTKSFGLEVNKTALNDKRSPISVLIAAYKYPVEKRGKGSTDASRFAYMSKPEFANYFQKWLHATVNERELAKAGQNVEVEVEKNA